MDGMITCKCGRRFYCITGAYTQCRKCRTDEHRERVRPPAMKRTLDDQLQELAHAMSHPTAEEDREALLSSLAFIREAWSGADAYDSPAEALEAIAERATEAAAIVRGRQLAAPRSHTPGTTMSNETRTVEAGGYTWKSDVPGVWTQADTSYALISYGTRRRYSWKLFKHGERVEDIKAELIVPALEEASEMIRAGGPTAYWLQRELGAS